MSHKPFNFWSWLRASFEETPGRASGKSITASVFAAFLIALGILVLFYAKIFNDDLKTNQTEILGTIITTIGFLIGSLFGIKAVTKSKWFSGGSGNDGSDDSSQAEKGPVAPISPPVNDPATDLLNKVENALPK